MSNKSKNKRVEICLMVVTASLVLAGLWAVLATPETALAKKPDEPPGQEEARYIVNVIFDYEAYPDGIGSLEAPTYLPSCSAETRGGIFSAWFERHDLCATVTTSTGNTLTDDISMHVGTNKAGKIISFQLIGQDIIGKEGIIHKSEVVTFAEPIGPPPPMTGFTLHVDVDNLEIWKYNKHLNVKGAKRVEMIGHISVCDLVYTPVEQ